MADFSFSIAGAALTDNTHDFGGVFAGMVSPSAEILVTNTSGQDFVDVLARIEQADDDGGQGGATINQVTLTAVDQSFGPLAAGASLTVVANWVTAAGTVGRVQDLADVVFTGLK